MTGVSAVLNMGKKALASSQAALNTVSHNISNANTPGFSRQEVSFEAEMPHVQGKHLIGSGVSVGQVKRIHDPFVERELNHEINKKNYFESLHSSYSRVEDTFNEFDGKGLSTAMASFFNSFRQLSMQPESSLARQSVVTNARLLSDRFNHVQNALQNNQFDIDTKLISYAREASELTKKIAHLNLEVRKVEITGGRIANDLRDQRDVAVEKLSEMMDVRVSLDEDESYTVDAEGLGTLVSKSNAMEITSYRTAADPKTGKAEGLSDLFLKLSGNDSQQKITSNVKGGAIGALLDMRDRRIPKMMERVNAMAEATAIEVNNLQNTGTGLNGEPGRDLFEYNTGVGAAASLRVNDTVVKDISLVAAGANPEARGDNRIALATAGLQTKRFMRDGQNTVEDEYNDFLADISIQSGTAKQNAENQSDLVRQLENYKLSQVGVNMDDEAIKMIRYQQMYGAAAKLIQTSDEMIQTVLNLKR